MHTAYSYGADPAIPAFADDRPIIIFDGFCALCSGWVNFILRHDRRKLFRFLPAQSPLGQALYVHYGLDPQDYETNILLMDGHAYLKSEGSIRMAEGLGAPWSFVSILRFLPLPLRDRLYEALARNRFRIFGRRDTCYLPAPAHDDRFLS